MLWTVPRIHLNWCWIEQVLKHQPCDYIFHIVVSFSRSLSPSLSLSLCHFLSVRNQFSYLQCESCADVCEHIVEPESSSYRGRHTSVMKSLPPPTKRTEKCCLGLHKGEWKTPLWPPTTAKSSSDHTKHWTLMLVFNRLLFILSDDWQLFELSQTAFPNLNLQIYIFLEVLVP